MAWLARPDGAVIWHRHEPPAEGGCTFVFFNALTGDSDLWMQKIVPALEARGHGTLVFDLRGQRQSPVEPHVEISLRAIVEDCKALVEDEQPKRPVYVGLSIGGLFAAMAHLEGHRAEGMVLINTLRENSPRLSWLGDAMVRCARTGGLRLLRDVYLPLLFGQSWLEHHRRDFLLEDPYEPLAEHAPEVRLLQVACGADWNIAWEGIGVPVLVLTGQEDHLFRDEAAIARIARRMPRAMRIDVPQAGHLLPAEAPEMVIDACLSLAGRLWEAKR